MADKHTSGDDRNGLNDSSPALKFHTAEGSTEEQTEDQNLWPRLLARKWVLMLFIGTCLLYCARMAMPICAVSLATSFHWSKIDSGLVLGGFFWGYCFTQILGGHVSDKVGGERVLFISAVSWAVVTAATPLVAHLGSHTVALMTTARFLMGLLQGVFYPSLASLCSQRVLEAERGFLMSTINCGSNLGILLAGAMGSLMLDRYGWESMFYCIGVLTGLWALIVWLCLLQVAPKRMETSRDTQWSLSGTRWRSLSKEPPVWAMVFAHMCMSSTFYTLLSWLPTYFKETFPHAMGSVYNVIPWLVAIPSSLAGGYMSSFLINKVHFHGHIECVYLASVWRRPVYLGCDFHFRLNWPGHLQQQWRDCECTRPLSIMCWCHLRFYEYVGCFRGTGVGLCVGLPDRGHDVVDVGVLAHHFSERLRPRDLPHLWRRSSCRPGRLQTGGLIGPSLHTCILDANGSF
ncbi:solute carrier family 17 member 9-like isoform X2 [Pseudoliparis swirei]|uniref:solute carrier family 17 member 9-like isoform X2 n=1 Tax=Pseudoliparis swirei TaxID=2059687 RepID=UPI0024BEC859|nr:solute carrier family 17 member 9-like isoform X2 [Pseudoliparis swirei]